MGGTEVDKQRSAGALVHLVCRRSELLELHVQLWVVERGAGQFGFPAAQNVQTRDGCYIKTSLCKFQKAKCHLSAVC